MQNSVLERFRKLLLSLILLCYSIFAVSGQQINYPAVFGKDWEKANEYLRENRPWMETMLRKNHIPYKIGAAIVFPELVRYSALRDKMEITLLKALYVNLGEDYANFSVGRFQIKPSFARSVMEKATGLPLRKTGLSFSDKPAFDDPEYRKSILSELEDPVMEFGYVVAFIKICEKKYTLPQEKESRLKFLSTAYNCGIEKDERQIQDFSEKRFFSVSLFSTANTYSYSDIALFWYKNN
ncbi:MAG TPA: hypothetical protein VHO68_14645 [Bacteroidales bacterium]|nr:hypothetical protein [Bacteroidales bacterium]